MECSKVHKDLIFYLEGNLDEEMSSDIREHLSTCSACSDFAAMLRDSLGIIERERQVNEDNDFADRVIAALPPGERTASILPISILRYVAAAAVIVFGVFTGINIAKMTMEQDSSMRGDLIDEAYYLNDMYHEPIESFFLLKYEDNE